MEQSLRDPENRLFFLFIVVCILLYLLGWLIPLMEIDAAQYANISREMFNSKQYIQVYDLGKDYLDKPPMLFWLSALSMKIFGVSDFPTGCRLTYFPFWPYTAPTGFLYCFIIRV